MTGERPERRDYGDQEYDDTRVLVALLIMALGIIIGSFGAEIVGWLL